MRITVQADFALRVLMYVALKEGETVTIRDIAAHYAISRHHLAKVAQRLQQGGFLQTTRGRNGGLVLSRRPEHINVGEVFRLIETDRGVVECLQESGSCTLTPCCELRRVFREATAEFLRVLDSHSLADLIPLRQRSQMRQQLQIQA